MGASFSFKLKELRKEKHMTQKEMAKILNVSRSCVANYESDRRQPDQESLIFIADYFHVSIDYLMGRTPEQKKEMYDERQKRFWTVSKEAESKKHLDLRFMDTESKILLLKFYRYLSTMQK